MSEKKLLYGGWILLLITFVFNLSLLICSEEENNKLEQEKQELINENSELKSRLWYCDQITYIIGEKKDEIIK